MNVNGKLLEEWNLANVKARQAYRHQMDLQDGRDGLPGSLVPRPAGAHGRPIRMWLLDVLVECEYAETRAIVAEHVADAALTELGEALMQIERLTRG